jgi:SAM-dependent methyltransferase
MKSALDRPDPALAAYEATAAHYDDFTAHYDYGLWLGNLLEALEAHGLTGSRLLDIACGTGKSFLPLLARGWEVTAVDLSPAMLEQARLKMSGKRRGRLELGDMRALPRLGSFDLVWCLDDAVNYLIDDGALEQCLAGFARNLAPTGLFLFDVNTLATYRGFFSATQTIDLGTQRLVWRGQASPQTEAGGEVAASFEVRSDTGQLIQRAMHRQRHFRPLEIQAALARVGLQCLAIYGHGDDARLEQPLDEVRHSKAVFVGCHGEGR